MRDGEIYHDPLGQYPAGADFRQNWIAAKRDVRLSPSEANGGTLSGSELDTGLVVLVQEDYDAAAGLVHQLGDSLFKQGVVALCSVVVLVVILWYSVARALGDPNEAIRRQGGVKPPLTTIHSMETIELPPQLRR